MITQDMFRNSLEMYIYIQLDKMKLIYHVYMIGHVILVQLSSNWIISEYKLWTFFYVHIYLYVLR